MMDNSSRRLTLSAGGRRRSLDKKVRTLLTIRVSSVELNARTQDFLQQQRQYLDKSFSFYELISINHEKLQDRLKDYLKQEIDGSVDEVSVTAEGLTVTVRYPQEKVITLQCHQSSGRLLADIQQCLVNKNTLQELNVNALSLMVQIQRM